MKEMNDSYYVEQQKKVVNRKVVEQCEELKSIFYVFKFGFLKRCPYNIEWSDIGDPDIKIRDKRYWSMESGPYPKYHPLFKGAIVAQFYPFDCIKVHDKNILDVVRKFGEKWNYKQLIKKWADKNPNIIYQR